MKINIIITAAVSLAALGSASCTGNYMEINSHPYQVTKEQMQADGYAVGSLLNGLASAVVSTDVNTAQFTDCLLGGPMGGYYATSGAFKNTIDNYNPTDDWTRVLMASDRIIPMLFTNLQELESVNDDPAVSAVAKVIKVFAMHRVTDTYGPIPYSQIGQDGKIQVAYDPQEKVYDEMFRELNEAISVLTENRAAVFTPTADYIYRGEAVRWCRLANSLKLRLAMRIVYADPAKAKAMAESAVNNEIGVITSNADNACLTSFGEKGNPLYVSVKYNEVSGSNTGGDTHAAADIVCYMNGYEDPRRKKYFIASEWDGKPYVGMRRGIEIPALGSVGRKYSGVNISSASPVCWMNAAEVAFLQAEAKAVFGFDIPGTAESLYNQGISLSFGQWNAPGYAAYAADNTKTPASYDDPAGTNTYSSQLSDITVAWDEGATTARKQERIITQKWIANFNLGNEAWADYRRTGYPKLIPATTAGNKSNGIVDSRLGARRMPYPEAEYTNNPVNVQEAVSRHLKGADNMATRVWWDCNPAVN